MLTRRCSREADDRRAEWESLHVLVVGFTVAPDDGELLRGVEARLARHALVMLWQ